MPFLRGMQDQGYIKGRDIDLVYRYADGYAQRLPALAEKLVRIKPNVILAPATAQVVAAKNATATIPIVTPALADAELGAPQRGRPQRGVVRFRSAAPADRLRNVRSITAAT